MENQMKRLVKLQSEGKHVGIYSVCSANEQVIRSALCYARDNRIPVLIEATANQVNQFGGYTGMQPADFAQWVFGLADQLGIARENVILGGDHLGPLVWRKESAGEAMAKAEALVAAFVKAGFRKIHIDTSMPLGTDMEDGHFGHALIAQRSAHLARICEDAWQQAGFEDHHVYVVGSEVPIPGGAFDDEMAVTDPDQFLSELELFHNEYRKVNVDPSNIVGFVVQPGVEFTNHSVHYYNRAKAAALCAARKAHPQIVFEGHSTDYQPPVCLREMVEDGIAILKVGPGLTNAAREGLFALENIAREMPGVEHVPLRKILLDTMNAAPGYWKPYYQGTQEEIEYQKSFGMSDRCRYYLSEPAVNQAISDLIHAFDGREIPIQMISQYLPMQRRSVQEGTLKPFAQELLLDYIAGCYREYHFGAGDMRALGYV